MIARWRGPALALALLAALPAGCSPRMVDPCDGDQGPSGCIGLRIDGSIGVLTRLWLAERGAWTGSTEIDPGTGFTLPVAVAVALPPFVSGSEYIEISAYRDQVLVSTALATVAGLHPGEHRPVTVTLLPIAGTTPDGGR